MHISPAMRIATIAVALACCGAAAFILAGRAPRPLPPSPIDGIAADPAIRPPAGPPLEQAGGPPAGQAGALPDAMPARPVFEPVRRDVRDVTPDHVLPAPRIEQSVIERLPAVAPPPPPARPARPERWRRARVTAPGRLVSDGRVIVIAGIEPLATDAACTLEGGASWPCGKHARAALRRLIRQRPVECDPVETRDEDGPVVTRCRIDGRDIGAWLVARGWAVPGAGSDYGPALEQARKAGLGQWRRRGQPGLPATGPVVLETGEAEDAALLAPGVTAQEALVPLTEPEIDASPAPAEEGLDVEPPERGGLNR